MTMSIIFQTAGIYTSFQQIENYEDASLSLNGPCDVLSHLLANALVGNQVDTPTIEMTFQAPVIHFREPTLIALMGAEFYAYTDDKRIMPMKVHLMEKGETLYFDQPKKGTRVYMAIAGGLQLDPVKMNQAKDYIINSGDRFELARGYSSFQRKLFENIAKRKETTWGIDAYSLARIYYSDVFHLALIDQHINASIQQAIQEDIYSVTNRFDRTGFILDGKKVICPECVDAQDITQSGAVQISKQGELVISLKSVHQDKRYPHIANIAPYHLPKLSQKKPGSKLYFKWITESELVRQQESYEKWLKTILTQIDFLHQKELNV
ncbi:allophanate hydrolase subunit 2 family protein [Macrococcoides caseolyticum]|uniref:allophanate hydrolase subunit 2 family protein n=1 Tax=Macrococcoides caseolyticum TaxID=69966 RepID=UPI001F1CF3C3|nr:allophanate hydrolase subunit 2 family protein [Macrococcus caseolyticus]MCE4955882.1 allophanate hydrolase subunit 2 family protein [Macrococcus caseolyticus]